MAMQLITKAGPKPSRPDAEALKDLEEKQKALKLPDVPIYYPSEEEQARTGFSEPMIKSFLGYLKVGMSIPDVCQLLALHLPHVKVWYSDNIYNFKMAADQAMAYNKLANVHNIQSAVDKTKVSSSQWWLERKFKHEYSKEVNVTVNNVLIDGTAKALLYAITKNVKDPLVVEGIKRDFRAQMETIKSQNQTNEYTPTLLADAEE